MWEVNNAHILQRRHINLHEAVSVENINVLEEDILDREGNGE